MLHIKGVKINLKRCFIYLCILILFFNIMNIFVDVMRFPEKYNTIWKYQLKNKIEAGDENALKYYNDFYIKNGIYLYEEN